MNWNRRARDILCLMCLMAAASCTAAWKSTEVNHSCQARTEDTRMDLCEVILLTSA